MWRKVFEENLETKVSGCFCSFCLIFFFFAFVLLNLVVWAFLRECLNVSVSVAVAVFVPHHF